MHHHHDGGRSRDIDEDRSTAGVQYAVSGVRVSEREVVGRARHLGVTARAHRSGWRAPCGEVRQLVCGLSHRCTRPDYFVAGRPAGLRVGADFTEVDFPAAGFAFAPAVVAILVGAETYLAVMMG